MTMPHLLSILRYLYYEKHFQKEKGGGGGGGTDFAHEIPFVSKLH